MFRPDKIQAKLFGIVGWNQSTVTGYNIVDAANLASLSGLKFQDASALITIKNIKESQEDISITDVNFNTLLSNMQKSAINEVCNRILFGESDHIQTVNLYPFEKTFSDTLDTSDKFVGFKIEPKSDLGKLAIVSQLELSFDADKIFKVYLFNSNVKTAIQEKEVTTIAEQSVITDVQWYITDDVAYKGGNFYIGYFEDDLDGAKPYKRNYSLSNFMYETSCFDLTAVKVDHTANVLDVSTYQNQPEPGGLNLLINVYKDYTEFIIRNKNKLAYVIQQQMAIKVLDLLKNSTKSNGTERRISQKPEVKQQIHFELHGFKDEHNYVQGLVSKVNRAIVDLRKDFFYEPLIYKATLR